MPNKILLRIKGRLVAARAVEIFNTFADNTNIPVTQIITKYVTKKVTKFVT